jgi:hypothetical protein
MERTQMFGINGIPQVLDVYLQAKEYQRTAGGKQFCDDIIWAIQAGGAWCLSVLVYWAWPGAQADMGYHLDSKNYIGTLQGGAEILRGSGTIAGGGQRMLVTDISGSPVVITIKPCNRNVIISDPRVVLHRLAPLSGVPSSSSVSTASNAATLSGCCVRGYIAGWIPSQVVLRVWRYRDTILSLGVDHQFYNE